MRLPPVHTPPITIDITSPQHTCLLYRFTVMDRRSDDGKRYRQGTSRGCGGGVNGQRQSDGPGAPGNWSSSTCRAGLIRTGACNARAPPVHQNRCIAGASRARGGEVRPGGGGAGSGWAAWRPEKCGIISPRATVGCVRKRGPGPMRPSESHCVGVCVWCACRWKGRGPTMSLEERWRRWAQLAVESDRGFLGTRHIRFCGAAGAPLCAACVRPFSPCALSKNVSAGCAGPHLAKGKWWRGEGA